MHTSAYNLPIQREYHGGAPLDAEKQRQSAARRRWMQKYTEGNEQSHFIKINKKVCIFPQNLSNLEAYDRAWTQGTLQTDRVNR